MASTSAFDLAGGGTVESGSITLLSGEVCRARFTASSGAAGLCFVITRGGVETIETIESDEIAYCAALSGDAVKLRLIPWNGTPTAVGVLETISG